MAAAGGCGTSRLPGAGCRGGSGGIGPTGGRQKSGADPHQLLGPPPFPGLVRGQQGAAAVEFAVVAPLFLILWFGVLDFGLGMYAKGLITHASQEGARYGAVYHLSPPTAG